MLYKSFDIIEILAVLIAVVIAMTLHEYAHARVAVMNGDFTPKQYNRLSLNPLRHIDLLGFFMLMTVGFGFAKPVPVNPNNFRKLRKGIFTVAIAGIATNIILAFLITPLAILALRGYLMSSPGFAREILWFIFLTLSYLITINLSLAIFNLLPLYPLDGFRVLESFTRYNNRVTSFLRVYGRYILLALIGIGIIIDYFNLKEVNSVFIYLDIIGFLIQTIGGYIGHAFSSLWHLILGGV